MILCAAESWTRKLSSWLLALNQERWQTSAELRDSRKLFDEIHMLGLREDEEPQRHSQIFRHAAEQMRGSSNYGPLIGDLVSVRKWCQKTTTGWIGVLLFATGQVDADLVCRPSRCAFLDRVAKYIPSELQSI